MTSRTPGLDEPDVACACGHISCVCELRAQHPNLKCRFRLAATGSIGIECEHGHDVCPICDPCTCEEKSDAPKR